MLRGNAWAAAPQRKEVVRPRSRRPGQKKTPTRVNPPGLERRNCRISCRVWSPLAEFQRLLDDGLLVVAAKAVAPATHAAKRAPAEAELTRSPGTRKSACRCGYMFDEQEIYLEDVIDSLRANEGTLFRAVLKKLLNDDSPDSTRLAEALVQHPDLRHLIAH